ncbi:hypothetical protein [Candidatus Phycosocius spiralis]|uniref:Uncharacterized protein n=1 Tax=Candidatus Phycosocius spiralis TaxID=2815099 RepID=A0ABQ4PUT1_9PROT|nr:hypothetical protein [Candidatus Phycosocius spiralis]GIU66743.1 hypothetical protein PsB1_0897 [Candidatus Phycosocius spiralis]
MPIVRRLFELVPLLAIPIGLYALLATITTTTRGADVFVLALARSAFVVALPSGGVWTITGGDLLVAMGLIIFFFEMTRGVGASRQQVFRHGLAILLALLCALGFYKQASFATSTFFLLTLMCWLDMIGGIVLSVASASSAGLGHGVDHHDYRN